MIVQGSTNVPGGQAAEPNGCVTSGIPMKAVSSRAMSLYPRTHSLPETNGFTAAGACLQAADSWRQYSPWDYRASTAALDLWGRARHPHRRFVCRLRADGCCWGIGWLGRRHWTLQSHLAGLTEWQGRVSAGSASAFEGVLLGKLLLPK